MSRNEATLAMPLSGAEVIEGIVDKLRKQLQQDCFLSPNAAYESFEALISYEIRALDVGRRPEIKGTIRHAKGNASAAAPMVGTVKIDPAPPNEVRTESEQPVPALVETQDGKRRIQPITYAKPVKAEAPDVASTAEENRFLEEAAGEPII